jgi:hypothetical protein
MNYVSDDVQPGENVKLSKFINLYGCSIGENRKIGVFVEIQKNAAIGKIVKFQAILSSVKALLLKAMSLRVTMFPLPTISNRVQQPHREHCKQMRIETANRP